MQDFSGKKIVLGICGGIAAYKSAYLVRELTTLGAEVRVVMTEKACAFITPLTLQALSGNPVRIDLFDEDAERGMGHIELARWADFLLIAPASVNCMAKMAQGLADDLLSTLYLATKATLILCPAMNQAMWLHPATQNNCKQLIARGAIVVGPALGEQACGDYGPGRLSDVESIVNAMRLDTINGLLSGKKVCITGGPTREAIDPVRYLSNHSSGKMAYALAEAAYRAGADVLFISGTLAATAPDGVRLISTESACEMYEAVMKHFEQDMIFIGCAAVADYKPEISRSQKIKKEAIDKMVLNLVKNPDILAEVAASGKASFVLGFAAETENVIEHARVKLYAKKVDMIIANQVGKEQGFNSDMNEVLLISADDELKLPLNNKVRLAGQIIAILAAKLQNGENN